MTFPARVLVTDMEERAALAACRGLDAAGYRVVGAASSRAASGLRSRACSERALLPDPRADADGFASAVAELVERKRIDLVLPSTDAALLALADDAARRAMDKVELARAAAAAGLPAPETIVCATEENALASAKSLGFPLVVKARTSVIAADGGARRQQPSAIVTDEDALRRALPPNETPVLLQRFQPDATVYSCGGVAFDGRLLGFAFSRYLRTWRPPGGSAAYAETIEPPAGLEDTVLAIVRELGWQGIFELELIGDDRPRHAIDFNPRPYGSMALAISAGVNVPAIWSDAVLGRDPKPARARPGWRYRFEEGDLRHLGWQLAHAKPRAALAVLVPRPRTTHALWRTSDPLPAVWEALRLVRKAASRFAGKTSDRAPVPLRSREAL